KSWIDRNDKPKATEHLKRAKDYAREMESIDPVLAALRLGSALEQEAVLNRSDAKAWADLLKVYSDGLQKKDKAQDKGLVYQLYLRRGVIHAGGKLAGGANLDAAFKDAEAAYEVARTSGLSKREQADALGAAGEYRYKAFSAAVSDPAKYKPYLQEFIRKFSQ